MHGPQPPPLIALHRNLAAASFPDGDQPPRWISSPELNGHPEAASWLLEALTRAADRPGPLAETRTPPRSAPTSLPPTTRRWPPPTSTAPATGSAPPPPKALPSSTSTASPLVPLAPPTPLMSCNSGSANGAPADPTSTGYSQYSRGPKAAGTPASPYAEPRLRRLTESDRRGPRRVRQVAGRRSPDRAAGKLPYAWVGDSPRWSHGVERHSPEAGEPLGSLCAISPLDDGRISLERWCIVVAVPSERMGAVVWRVMISSTEQDLRDYRRAAVEICHRQKLQPA